VRKKSNTHQKSKCDLVPKRVGDTLRGEKTGTEELSLFKGDKSPRQVRRGRGAKNGKQRETYRGKPGCVDEDGNQGVIRNGKKKKMKRE